MRWQKRGVTSHFQRYVFENQLINFNWFDLIIKNFSSKLLDSCHHEKHKCITLIITLLPRRMITRSCWNVYGVCCMAVISQTGTCGTDYKDGRTQTYLLYPTSLMFCPIFYVLDPKITLMCYAVFGGTRWRSGWGIALQAGRSRARFPMVSLDFFFSLT